ncbi:MAG: PAS domain S-box protein, partial [Planctomycetota bacterium]
MPATSLTPSYKHPDGRPIWLRYGVAVLCVILATLARAALTPTIGPTALPFIFFFPLIALATWYGGFAPGLVATLLACVATIWFFFEPDPGFGIRLPDRWALAAFVTAALVIVGAIEMMHRAKGDLIQSHDQLSTTLASIGDGVIVADAQGRVLFLNPVAERLTRWSSSEARGQPVAAVFRIINEDTRHPVDDPIQKVLRLGTTVGLANHTLLVAKDGTEIPVEDSGAPILRPGGILFGAILVFRDSSEQRKSAGARARLAVIVENSEDVILSKNLDGTILTWNAAAERMFGYRAEEIVGKPVTTLIPPELQQEEAEILGRLRRGLSS